METNFLHLQIERISLPVKYITVGYICCLDVQNFAKMTVPSPSHVSSWPKFGSHIY